VSRNWTKFAGFARTTKSFHRITIATKALVFESGETARSCVLQLGVVSMARMKQQKLLRVRSLRAGLLAAALIAPAAAFAASPAVRAPAVQALVDCRKLEDGAARLACYDSAVAALTAAEDKGDLVSLDREQRRTVRRQAFGFSMPSLAIFDTGEKPEALNKIDYVLAAAGQDAQGKWTFRMQDGAVWRQIDDNELSRPPRPGSKIVVSRAVLGSYMLSVDGQPGVRAHRDN
jgi:hypothetical protein